MTSASRGPLGPAYNLQLIGVDPGLRDTGIVECLFYNEDPSYDTYLEKGEQLVLSHATAEDIWGELLFLIAERAEKTEWRTVIYVEKYLDRGTSFGTHGRMRELETQLRLLAQKSPILQKAGSLSFVNNTGVKKIITNKVLTALQLDTFTTASNHQDLKSAARIALYGAAKDKELNPFIYKALCSAQGVAF